MNGRIFHSNAHALLRSVAAKAPAVASVSVSSLLVVAILTTSSGPSWSFDVVKPLPPSTAVSAADNYIMPSTPVLAHDPCQPLLKIVSQTSNSSYAIDRDRRSAGRAAVLGLVLGVRFALGPREVSVSGKPAVSLDFLNATDTGGAKALAIADYRRCRNEQALQAINDWRWSR